MTQEHRKQKLKNDLYFIVEKTIADAIASKMPNAMYTKQYKAGLITPQEYIELQAPEVWAVM